MRRLLALAALLAATLLVAAASAHAACSGTSCNGTTTYPSPTTSITAGAADPTKDPRPDFTFAANLRSAYFECRFAGSLGEAWPDDNAGVFPCGGPIAAAGGSAGWEPLADRPEGANWLRVRACKDYEDPEFGVEFTKCDMTPSAWNWMADYTGPAASFAAGARDGARVKVGPSYTLAGGETGGRYQCRLDSTAFSDCTATPSFGGVTIERAYTVWVRAVDALGNAGPQTSRTFVLDKTGPVVDASSPGLTRDSTPTWSWSASQDAGTANAVACFLDGEAVPCGEGSFTPAQPLADGDHTFLVRATDEAGNQSAGDGFANVDTIAPALAAPVWNAATKQVTFTAPGEATTTCRLDGGAFGACASPFDAGRLAPGQHTFTVRAVDAAGNAVERPVTFTIPAPPKDEPKGDDKPAGDKPPGDTGGENPTPPAQAPPAVTPPATVPLPPQAGVTPQAPVKRTTAKKAKKPTCAALKKARTKKAKARAKAKCKKAAAKRRSAARKRAA